MNFFLKTFLSLYNIAKAVIKRKLILLEDLAASVAHERPKSKILVFKSLSTSVEFAISLFPIYLQQADVLDLLIGFFLTLFDSLKSQVNWNIYSLIIIYFVKILVWFCAWNFTEMLAAWKLSSLPSIAIPLTAQANLIPAKGSFAEPPKHV